MDIIIITISLILTATISLYWGEVLSVRLPEIDKCFDRKPFNCRPCFTFHLAWMLSAFVALVSQCPINFYLGIILAFALFLIVKYIDNKKITK